LVRSAVIGPLPLHLPSPPSSHANINADMIVEFLFSIFKKYKRDWSRALSSTGPKHLAKIANCFLTPEEKETSLSYVKKKTYVHKKKPAKGTKNKKKGRRKK
jgi:hypothetical protein